MENERNTPILKENVDDAVWLKSIYRTCTVVRSVSHFTSSSLISLPLPLKRLTKITCL